MADWRSAIGPVLKSLPTLLGGGLAGAALTWYVNQPMPTVVTYRVITTTVVAVEGPAARAVIPKLRIQLDGKEVKSLYTHTIELSVPRGPHVDRAEVAIAFSGLSLEWDLLTSRLREFGTTTEPTRVFGMISEAPSPVHRIDCEPLKDGARCVLSPLSSATRGSFRVTLAINRRQAPSVVMAEKNVELIKAEDFLEREATSLRAMLTRVAPWAGLALALGFGVGRLLSFWRESRR